jgi:hypothetical protein
VVGLGLAGSVLIALAGLLLASPQNLSTNTSSAWWALVATVGLVAQAFAWMALCKRTFSTQNPMLSRLILTSVLWCLPLLALPSVFSGDAWVYAANSIQVAMGISPYTHVPGELSGPIVDLVHANWRHETSRYGPVFQLLAGAIGLITHSPWPLVVLHRMLNLAGAGMLILGLIWLAPSFRRRPADLVALVGLSPVLITICVATPHNDLLMMGLLVLSFGLAARKRTLDSLVLCGLAVGIKPTAGLGVLLIVALLTGEVQTPTRQLWWRFAWGSTVVVAVPLLLATTCGWLQDWVPSLSSSNPVLTPLAASGYLRETFAAQHVIVPWLEPMLLITSLVVIGVVALRTNLNDIYATLHSLIVITIVLLLGAPIVQAWYLMWLLPLLALRDLPRGGWLLFYLVLLLGAAIALLADYVGEVAVGLGFLVVVFTLGGVMIPWFRKWLIRLGDIPGVPQPTFVR